MEITRELVDGYVAAVAAALEAAGHTVTVPAPDYPEELRAEIIIPDAWTDERERSGMVLQLDLDGTWVAGLGAAGWVGACYAPETGRRAMHTALLLGVVPAPEVVMRSVAATVADGGFTAGRVVPGAAELLARYGSEVAPRRELVNLVELAIAGDSDGWLEACVVCGAEEVEHRGLWVSAPEGALGLVAWCAADECQQDREKSVAQSVPLARSGEGYRVADRW